MPGILKVRWWRFGYCVIVMEMPKMIFYRCLLAPWLLDQTELHSVRSVSLLAPWLLDQTKLLTLFCYTRSGDVAVYVFDIDQPSLPTHFYSVLVSVSVSIAPSTVFHSSSNSPNNSPFSLYVLPVLHFCLIGPFNCLSFCESLPQPRYNPL